MEFLMEIQPKQHFVRFQIFGFIPKVLNAKISINHFKRKIINCLNSSSKIGPLIWKTCEPVNLIGSVISILFSIVFAPP